MFSFELSRSLLSFDMCAAWPGGGGAAGQRQTQLGFQPRPRANTAPAALAVVPPVAPAPAVPPGQFVLTGGTGPPIPAAPPLGVGGANTAINYLRQRLRAINLHHHNHQMFNAITHGQVCMPYHTPGRANAVCWYNAIESLCSRHMNPPLVWGHNHCWMSNATQYKITRPKTGGGTELCKSFRAVRFFAFLMTPTDANWIALRDGMLTAPFDHFCGRGEATDPNQNGLVCINGVEHGEFSNRNWNEERKQCKNGARCLCPGHGPNAVKCIFTHPDGLLRVCRNQATHVPQCTCNPRCF